MTLCRETLRDNECASIECQKPTHDRPNTNVKTPRGAKVSIQVTILAAGMGTRLGQPFPKPLTPLRDGRTIMHQQFDNIGSHFEDARTYVEVGVEFDLIMDAHAYAIFIYNERFKHTNTSKSLLKALRQSAPGGMLWFNGDVVFAPELLDRLKPLMDRNKS